MIIIDSDYYSEQLDKVWENFFLEYHKFSNNTIKILLDENKNKNMVLFFEHPINVSYLYFSSKILKFLLIILFYKKIDFKLLFFL
jgi:hypothetical protein